MDAALLWSIRKPIAWVWKKLAALLGRWTVEPIYRQSHEYHVALRRWQKRWVEMADAVEYKLHTRSSFDGDGLGEQSIWIRNSGVTVIDEIHFCIEAKHGNLSYQVPQSVYRLRPGCIARLALPGLPLQDLFVRNDGIFSTYESIQVYPVRIERNCQTEMYSTNGAVWDPTHDDVLNGEWTLWNNRLFSIKAIGDARREYFLRLGHTLCWRHGLFGFDAGTLLTQAIRRRHFQSLAGAVIFTILTWRPILKAIHWTRLLLRIERIDFELDPSMAAASEYVMHKGESAAPSNVIRREAAP